MADYKKLKPFILKWEGGYAGNVDGASCTMKGITLATFRAYYGKNKNCKDLKNITDSQWDMIFIDKFWDRWLANNINSQSIANLLVDWLWNCGVYGITYPQRVLGVKADGVVGNKTISAVNDYPNQEELFNKLWNSRKNYYISIAKGNKKKFLNGWLNRLNEIKWED